MCSHLYLLEIVHHVYRNEPTTLTKGRMTRNEFCIMKKSVQKDTCDLRGTRANPLTDNTIQ